MRHPRRPWAARGLAIGAVAAACGGAEQAAPDEPGRALGAVVAGPSAAAAPASAASADPSTSAAGLPPAPGVPGLLPSEKAAAQVQLPDGFDDEPARAYLAERRRRRIGEAAFDQATVDQWGATTPECSPMPEKDWRWHPMIEGMTASRFLGGPERCAAERRSFVRPIPRLLHRVRVGEAGDKERLEEAHWATYARHFGYDLKIWQAGDAPALLAPASMRAFARLRERQMDVAAAQLLGASVLARRGGILLGRQATPPAVDGQPFDLADHLPMRGLVAVAAPRSRLLRGTSVWVLWDFVMACAEHPVMVAVEDRIPANLESLGEAAPGGVAFATGSVLLSQVLGGAFTLIPPHSLEEMGILSAPEMDR